MVSPVPPTQRDSKAKRIQKQISAYLTGGTKKVPGITGKEKVNVILQRLKTLKLSGREALVALFGEKRVREIELGAKTDFVKKWMGLATARGIKIPSEDLKRLPEPIRERGEIKVSKSELLFIRKGFSRFREESGRVTWRDSKGRYSKGPRRSRRR